MIISIPYSDGTNEACTRGPAKILEQLKDVWCNESYKKIIPQQSQECSIEDIKDGFIYLGGDHTISYYTIKHLQKKHKDMALLVFDAHPDVFQAFATPSHQDYLRFLIEDQILDPKKVIVVGIRAPDVAEIEYYRKKGIKFIPCKDIDIEAVCDGITEFLIQFPALYLSIDLDVLDPAFAPGVSYIEPAGLTSRELMYFISRIKLLKNLKALDIVELNPDKDINNMTSKMAAKVLAEFI